MYGSKPSAQRRQLNGGARGHTTLGRGNRGTSRGRGRGGGGGGAAAATAAPPFLTERSWATCDPPLHKRTDGQAVFKSRRNVVGQILHQVQRWAFRLPPLVGKFLHLHTRQFTGMITSLG